VTQGQASPPLSATTTGTTEMFPLPSDFSRPGAQANENGVIRPFSPIMEFGMEAPPRSGGEVQMNELDPMLSLPTPKDQPDADGLEGGSSSNAHERPTVVPSQQQPLPNGHAAGAGQQQDGDKDPFLNLLQQLADNEQSRGGPSELDFFLSTN
jgi:hypothetical protein